MNRVRRYQVLEQVGAAAFSRAVQAYDTLERRLVCLKVVKVGSRLCWKHCLRRQARCAAILSVPGQRYGRVALVARALLKYPSHVYSRAQNDKECMDACLEEVRLLQMINARDPRDEHHIARLYDYFYHAVSMPHADVHRSCDAFAFSHL